MADIFISYAKKDRSRVEPLAKALEGQGWSVFWDRTIPAGKTWRQVIGEALENARSVIVAWSKISVESNWVQEEADRGLERNILIPVLIDNVRPPLGFGAIQAADLISWKPTQSSPEFGKLISDISAILDSPTIEVKKAEQKPTEEKRRIDAVAPSNASVGHSMSVFVQVRFPDSKYLSIEDWPVKIRPSSIELASKSTKVRFSKNSKGKLAPAHLKFKIVAPEFTVESEKEKTIKVPPNEFSERISFQLTPKSPGMHGIMVNVCDEKGISVGELPVETDVYEQEKPSVIEAIIVVLSLNVLVDLESPKVSEQAGDERRRKEAEREAENGRKHIQEEERKLREEEQKRREAAQKERKQKEAEAKRRADEEQQLKEKKERKLKSEEERERRDIITRAETDKLKAEAKETIESVSSEPRKTGKALKFSAAAVVMVLLIAGIWLWVSRQQVNEVRQELEKLDRQVLNLENAITKINKVDQIEELSKQRDTLNHQVEGLSEQAIKAGMRSQLEQLQNRLERIQIELANKEKEVIAALQKAITNSIGMKFVLIPSGSFTMGSQLSPEEIARRFGGEAKFFKDEHPAHTVEITKPFYMQTTEVSQEHWGKVMLSNPSSFKDCGDDCPVEQVSWDMTQEFISKLNQMEGTTKYRLPTEAEWEYACRAETTTPFHTGECISTDQANYDGNYPAKICPKGESREKTINVGSFQPNAWGLYDMHGNVWEWCQDWYGDYPSGPIPDPKGPDKGEFRVLRGGSWNFIAWSLRSASRYWDGPGHRSFNSGFRVARDF